MKRTATNPTTEAEAYRGYLIRFSAMSQMLGRAAYWIEKDNHFISHAKDTQDAKATIRLLTE